MANILYWQVLQTVLLQKIPQPTGTFPQMTKKTEKSGFLLFIKKKKIRNLEAANLLEFFFLLSKWICDKKKSFLLNFRGAALSTLQTAQTERIWRRQGLILNVEHHFPHMQQWVDQEVTLGLTEQLRQHVARRPQPRSAFQQSDQRFMAKLSSLHLNCKSTAKKKKEPWPRVYIKSAQSSERGRKA